jgi:hypothetical protein
MKRSRHSQISSVAIAVAAALIAFGRADAVCSGKLKEVKRGNGGNGKTVYEYEIQNTSNPADPNCEITDFHIFHGANNTGQPITINACRVPRGWSLKGVDDNVPIAGDPVDPPAPPVIGGTTLGGFRIISDDGNPPASDVTQGSGYKLSFKDGSLSALQDNAGAGGFHAPRHNSGSSDAVTPADPAGVYPGSSCKFLDNIIPAMSPVGELVLIVLLVTCGGAILVWRFRGA